MKNITIQELNAILEKHALWLNRDKFGKRANLSHTDLRDIDLTGVDLSFADLSYTNLSNANLTDANLSGVNLRGTNLSYANLRDAQLTGVELIGADLNSAELLGAELRGAELSGTNLNGADLSYTNTLNVAGFYSMDNVGTFNGRITFSLEHDLVWADCWKGSLDEFKVKCKEVIEKNPELEYELNICVGLFEYKNITSITKATF